MPKTKGWGGTTVTEVAGDSTIDTEVNGELLIFTETVDESFTVTVFLGNWKTLTEFFDTTSLFTYTTSIRCRCCDNWLYQPLNFCTSLSSLNLHSISNPPWAKSAEHHLDPVTSQLMDPRLLKKTHEIFFGTWPTTMAPFLTATA